MSDRTPATPRNPQNRFSKVSLDSCLSKARYPDELREIANGDKADQDQAGGAPQEAEAGPERQAEAPRVDATGRRDSRAWVQDRLRACFDARPELSLATGRAQRGRMREDFH